MPLGKPLKEAWHDMLQFLIDTMCANFTVEAMSRLVKTLLADGPSTVSEIAHKITEKDRTLDIKSAEILAQAAVEALTRSGDIVVQGVHIALAGPTRE